MHPGPAIGTGDVGIALRREPWQHGEAVGSVGRSRPVPDVQDASQDFLEADANQDARPMSTVADE